MSLVPETVQFGYWHASTGFSKCFCIWLSDCCFRKSNNAPKPVRTLGLPFFRAGAAKKCRTNLKALVLGREVAAAMLTPLLGRKMPLNSYSDGLGPQQVPCRRGDTTMQEGHSYAQREMTSVCRMPILAGQPGSVLHLNQPICGHLTPKCRHHRHRPHTARQTGLRLQRSLLRHKHPTRDTARTGPCVAPHSHRNYCQIPCRKAL